MKNILARAHREVLDQFAWSSVLIAFDYDGTLAPIVADPDRAAMRPRTRRLLAELAALYPCIVVSGRARADTRARLDGVKVRAIIGNHGMESWQGANGFAEQVKDWHQIVARQLANCRGVTVEDKAMSLAIHYRQARAKRSARVAALRAAASLGPVRIIGGKQVVNVLPENTPHKGDALQRERERLGCDTAIYIGDDETDEDVFRLDQPGRLLTIRVGAKRTLMAAYCIRDQRQIDPLIEILTRLRTDHRPPWRPRP